jgi:ribonuclease Z
MEITFLGTGAGTPGKWRNVTSSVLHLHDEGEGCWMFDCGEGTQHQILRTPIKLGRINRLFVTHLHGDHIFGIPGMLSTRSNQGAETPLVMYGPKGIAEYVRTAMRISESRMKFPAEFVEIEEGVILDNERFRVEARHVDHRIECFGFRITEKDRPGRLDAERLKAQGIPSGPLFAAIKRGETVTLDDGRMINGQDYIGPALKGRVLAIVGDTRLCRAAAELAKDADLLVHEATFCADESTLAHDYGHSTTLQAAETALAAGAAKLIMTHISSRYQEAEDGLVEEARSLFAESHLAHDFQTFEIPRKRQTLP